MIIDRRDEPARQSLARPFILPISTVHNEALPKPNRSNEPGRKDQIYVSRSQWNEQETRFGPNPKLNLAGRSECSIRAEYYVERVNRWEKNQRLEAANSAK